MGSRKALPSKLPSRLRASRVSGAGGVNDWTGRGAFPQGLKPPLSCDSMSELKLRPPKRVTRKESKKKQIPPDKTRDSRA
jgi:hypothetical protein